MTEGTKDESRASEHDAAATKPRQEEATSDETLAELESTQTDAASGKGASSGASSTAETATPSPDGAFDVERGGRADGSDSGDPM